MILESLLKTPIRPHPPFPVIPPSNDPAAETAHREAVDRLVGPPYAFQPHIIEQRRTFFDMLVRFNTRHDQNLTQPPTVSKQPIDLHRLYLAVQENGGFEQVTKSKTWKNLCLRANPEMQESSAAGYQLRKHYMTYLLKLECETTGQNEAGMREFAEKIKKVKKRKPKVKPEEQAPTPDQSSTPGGNDQAEHHRALNAPSTPQSAAPQAGQAAPPASSGNYAVPPPPQGLDPQQQAVWYQHHQQRFAAAAPPPGAPSFPPVPDGATTPNRPPPTPQQPQRPPRPSLTQAVVAPPTALASAMRREPLFPAGSVEASVPSTRKKRKLMARDVGKIDAWRLVMALKSGLHAEVHWALNILNILLYDDSSVAFFNLSSLPGLLESLTEHLRRSLIDLTEVRDPTWTEIEPSTSAKKKEDDEIFEHLLPEDIELTPPSRYSHKGDNSIKYDSVDMPGRLVRKLVREKNRSLSVDAESSHNLNEYDDENSTVYERCTRSASTYLLWAKGGGCPTIHLKSGTNSAVCDSSSLSYSRYQSVIDATSRKRRRSPTPVKEPSDEEKAKWLLYHHEATESERRALDSEEIKWIHSTALRDNNESQQRLIDKVLAISNALRALCLVQSNEIQMACHPGLLLLLGRLLTYYHDHVPNTQRTSLTKNESSSNLFNPAIDDVKPELRSASKLASNEQKHIDLSTSSELAMSKCFDRLREDAFVILTQLSVVLDLFTHEIQIAQPIVSGLVHWVTCSSTKAKDILKPGVHSPLEYALEALCKLSVKDENIDMLLSLSPWPVVEKFVQTCARLISFGTEQRQVMEFCIVLLHAVCMASPAVCVHVGTNTNVVQYLVTFLEHADNEMHSVVRRQSMDALRHDPELMGTSVGMLRRAAGTLHAISKISVCRRKFIPHQIRLLQFTMSQLMDARVATMIAETLYEIQKMRMSPIAIIEHKIEPAHQENFGEMTPHSSKSVSSNEEELDDVKKEEPDESSQQSTSSMDALASSKTAPPFVNGNNSSHSTESIIDTPTMKVDAPSSVKLVNGGHQTTMLSNGPMKKTNNNLNNHKLVQPSHHRSTNDVLA